MKKLLTIILVMVFVLGLAGVAVAASDTGLENSPAFSGDTGHWTHECGDLRFDTDTGRTVVPGDGGDYANKNSVVHDHDGETLVDPDRTWD